MIISVWRYSHLALAVSSFLLLIVAAVTGIVLAFEPVAENAQGYRVHDFDKITLAQSMPALRQKLHGLQEIAIDHDGFVIAKYTNEEDKDVKAYINPLTGDVLGVPKEKSPLFQWMTNLHRSIFLHETGRAIVGVAAFLLILIALSGMALIIRRQKGIRRFFLPIEKTGFAQYYHTVFGRLALIFILALACTGTYLSVSRFIIKPQKLSAKVDDTQIKEEPEKDIKDFPIFQQTLLQQVETIQFPFSDFPEDYYTLKLRDKELCINQITGDILAEQVYPRSYQLSNFSLEWHTGRGHPIWAIIMAITAAYILFFIYSGAIIAWKRITSRSKNKYTAADSSVIILVGSENGSTYQFASAIFKQLLKHGEKVYLTDLDNYGLFPNAKHIIIMTSTYGEGDPPSNSKRFITRLIKYQQTQTLRYSVVGFGSRSYNQFCQFAYDVHQAMQQHTRNIPLLDVITVNDRSPQDFSHWITEWTKQTGYKLIMPRHLLETQQQGLQPLAVVDKTQAAVGESFLIHLKTKRFKKVDSGDLLAIYPKNDHRERLYSVGKVNGNIQLSIKLHDHGLGSSHLHGLNLGESIRGKIIRNKHFHFPGNASRVIMISNGTGIAPFLGMISENKKEIPSYLYCGFRTRKSFAAYEKMLSQATTNKRLHGLHLALSREEQKNYVSELVTRDGATMWDVLAKGGVIMICGSLAMQSDVLAVLNDCFLENGNKTVETFIASGQIRTDCY